MNWGNGSWGMSLLSGRSSQFADGPRVNPPTCLALEHPPQSPREIVTAVGRVGPQTAERDAQCLELGTLPLASPLLSSDTTTRNFCCALSPDSCS